LILGVGDYLIMKPGALKSKKSLVALSLFSLLMLGVILSLKHWC